YKHEQKRNQRDQKTFYHHTLRSDTDLRMLCGCGKEPENQTERSVSLSSGGRNVQVFQHFPKIPFRNTWKKSCTDGIPTGTGGFRRNPGIPAAAPQFPAPG